jgi:hypothetical protein
MEKTDVQVRTKLSYNCGCGFNSAKFSQASIHVIATGHEIQVSGYLKKEKGGKI